MGSKHNYDHVTPPFKNVQQFSIAQEVKYLSSAWHSRLTTKCSYSYSSGLFPFSAHQTFSSSSPPGKGGFHLLDLFLLFSPGPSQFIVSLSIHSLFSCICKYSVKLFFLFPGRNPATIEHLSIYRSILSCTIGTFYKLTQSKRGIIIPFYR